MGVLYLGILLIKTIYATSFPGSITNELKSERELKELKGVAGRQETISNFLVQTMQRLNGQTCALNYGDDTHLCDKGISNGIHELIEPIIDNTYFLLDTVNTGFTVGVYLNEYCSIETPENWGSGLIVIDDRLEKSRFLPKELFNNSGISEEPLEIQTAIRRSFNNQEFVVNNFKSGNESYTIICSHMPVACNENDGLGVLFIISKAVHDLPTDLSIHLKIFGRGRWSKMR
ncbi:hypothetical protein [Hymenobacter lapidarius]|uniref:hypothetical protein n=1 Tax=Hymenobacter lapidarius TaxID=1908237 RepID=UPI000F7850F9|nr:hypothetical protein [Hymenobacter lapidarius]